MSKVNLSSYIIGFDADAIQRSLSQTKFKDLEEALIAQEILDKVKSFIDKVRGTENFIKYELYKNISPDIFNFFINHGWKITGVYREFEVGMDPDFDPGVYIFYYIISPLSVGDNNVYKYEECIITIARANELLSPSMMPPPIIAIPLFTAAACMILLLFSFICI